MNDDSPNVNRSLSLAVVTEVDTLCDRFEAALRSGSKPVIEAYLAEASEAARVDLLPELLRIEIAYHLDQHEAPPPDYKARFPDQASLIDRACANPRPSRGVDSPLPSVETQESSLPKQGQMLAPLVGPFPVRLGDFLILREIGRGGMGVVYEAEDLAGRRRVALKVLPFLASLDARHLQRFRIEAQACANLRHDHIVPVHDMGCEQGVHYYTMEYIPGQNLATIIRELRRLAGREVSAIESTIPFPDEAVTPSSDPHEPGLELGLTLVGSINSPAYFKMIARFGLEAAEALHYAHACKVVHRDIKPGNLLVDEKRHLWITDFGLAQMDNDNRLTMTGELVGTLRYMSPEQALAKRVVIDHRTDVYSLGATLYELLTLEPIFRSRTTQELIGQIAFEGPMAPRRLNRQLPRDLETIVLTAVAKAPGQRYATAQHMADDLRRFLDDQPIKGRRPGPLSRLGRWMRRRAAGVTIGLAAAVVVAVLLGAYFLRPSAPPIEKSDADRRQEALQVINQDLDAGRTVVLIGEKGSPAYYRWRTDDTLGKITLGPDGEFTVQHWGYGLLELLPATRRAAVKLSAEVRHDVHRPPEGSVGIYFFHSEQPFQGISNHLYANLFFTDLTDIRRLFPNQNLQGNVVHLNAHLHPSTGMIKHSVVFPREIQYFTPGIATGPSPWLCKG
jgi:serine/threonine protein kinase